MHTSGSWVSVALRFSTAKGSNCNRNLMKVNIFMDTNCVHTFLFYKMLWCYVLFDFKIPSFINNFTSELKKRLYLHVPLLSLVLGPLSVF